MIEDYCTCDTGQCDYHEEVWAREIDEAYEDAIEQESHSEDLVYDGDLLVGEIIKQESGMICLATNYMLIVDIDCGEDIDRPLGTLFKWVNRNGGSFRVYKTKNGMRYFQTDIMYQGVNNSAVETLFALGSDPNYINLCKKGGRFMARLSPKLSNSEIERYFDDKKSKNPTDISVCHFMATVGLGLICSSLVDLIKIHDKKTQCDRVDLKLC